MDIIPGIYLDERDNPYEVVLIAEHSETSQRLVICIPHKCGVVFNIYKAIPDEIFSKEFKSAPHQPGQ